MRTDGLKFKVVETDGSRIQRLEVEMGLGPVPAAGRSEEPADVEAS